MRTFAADDRAIEGLPVRLVIALVVGVASLGVMMNMISGISGLTHQELDVRPNPEVVEQGEGSITFTVVGPDGDPVEDATVIVKAGTANLDSVTTGTTGEDGSVRLSVSPDLRPNQAEGTLVVDVKPPASGGYADERDNTDVLVVDA
ncbi:MAG: carboxypeptidase regulatory-like domain-containing protein [Halobacteriales archaeon]